MADSWNRDDHFCSVCGGESFVSYYEVGTDNLIDRRCKSHPRVTTPSEPVEGSDLLESVTKLGEAFEFVVDGLIAAAERARAVGSATVPLVAIDNLLLEYARRFINE